ncbi:DUF6083 domain-containing protein [Streptomyces inhibens]|uniref:DUF6083 domain-containing protein n=1 Tax=Streptomyces inhibens TaxID=2293571 RepID=UPI0037B735DA
MRSPTPSTFPWTTFSMPYARATRPLPTLPSKVLKVAFGGSPDLATRCRTQVCEFEYFCTVIAPYAGRGRHGRRVSGALPVTFTAMCTTTASAGRRWDGSPARPHHRPRALCVAADSPSRLLRAAQPSSCRDCGNRIDWYTRTNHHVISLHPHEVTATSVPASCRWHVSSGIAHPAHDGTPWCRVPHTPLCPARPTSVLLTPQLVVLRQRLALRTRRLLDTGALTPQFTYPAPTRPAASCRPARPVVQLLCCRYLAQRPLDDIQCVAQTRLRHRCTHAVLAPDAPAGTWTLMSATPSQGKLATPTSEMAVYNLNHLPYVEQLRWRAQRCPLHATAPQVADLALSEWEVFDPLLHHCHMHPRLPTAIRHRTRHT